MTERFKVEIVWAGENIKAGTDRVVKLVEKKMSDTATERSRRIILTEQEVIRAVCAIVSLAYHSIGDYSEASDGFCETCRAQHGSNWNYANSGRTIEYVRQAVLEKLKADGHKIDAAFDPETGKEI